jgi:hypothetical protein
MTDNINLQISGTPEAVLRFLDGLRPSKQAKPEPWWKIETPWFERNGKLSPEEAADMEVGFYGKRKSV